MESVQTVHGTCAGVDQVRHLAVAAALQNVGHANKIALRVRHWIFNGVAHAGLRRQVNHAVELVVGEHGLHSIRVAQIQLCKCEIATRLKPRQARLLKRGVVIVVHVVKTNNTIAAVKQLMRGE